MFSVILSLAIITSLLGYAYFSLAHFQKIIPFSPANNVLILTAHPDDECMFFGPTITSLRTLTKSKVHVLCLSTGNADGLGTIRKKELVKSCQIFGIPASRASALDNAELQDGMKNNWNPQVISRIVKDYVLKQKIDTIITFDDGGVSGHANHIATYQGARHYIQNENPKNVNLYRLESVNLARKYIGIIDFFVRDKKQDKIELISPPISYLVTHKAMRQHHSQLVWFRWLYVTFSRYMFINDLILDPIGCQ